MAGLREVKVKWSEELKGTKGIGPVLGDAVHANLEAYWTGAPWPYPGFPAEVATPMLPHLPDPHTTPDRYVERSLGNHEQGVDLPRTSRNDGPTRGLRVHGVTLAGFKDFLARPPGADGWRVYDYKSTKNIKQYSLSPSELARDVQCNLYALDTAIEFDQPETECRWIYSETADKRRAESHDLVIRADAALAMLEEPCIFAREELDTITDVDKAEQNPSACYEYGRVCRHHHTQGGPCSAVTSPGALMQARVPKKGLTPMPLNPELLAKYGAKKAETAPTSPVDAPVITEAATSAPELPAAEQPTLPATPEAKAAPKPKAAARAAKAPGSFAQLASELAESEAALAGANERLESAKAAMRAALG